MSKIVLHIGMHKTATTTIQEVLLKHHHAIYQKGLVYPRLPMQHHGLVAHWTGLPEVYHYPGGAEGHWRHITQTHKDSDRTVLISTEEMSRASVGRRVDFAQLRAWIDGFDQIEVVCFLRDQLSLMQSAFFQTFRKHPNAIWEDALHEAFHMGQTEGVFLDYNALYDSLLENFSTDEITFLPYKCADEPEVSPLDMLLRHIGYADVLPYRPKTYANKSPEPLQTWLSAQINHPDGFDETIMAQMQPIFEGRGTTMYTRTQAARIIEIYDPINAAFCARYPKFSARNLQMADLASEGYFFRDDLTPSVWINLIRALQKG